MGDVIEELIARGGVRTAAPARRSDVDAVSRAYGAALPEPLVRLWRRSDGLVLEPLDAHVPGPSELLRFLADERFSHWTAGLIEDGFVPVLDDHQSNYLVVTLREPLAFRVLYVPHDDGSRLIYRSMESCLSDLLRAMGGDDSADIYLNATTGDYPPDAPRPIDDQEAARALLCTDGEHGEWNYAAQLLDASNLHEWARLLETEHFVRRDVRERMQQMSSPAIRELLQKADASFDVFADAAAEAARRAGLKVGARDGEVLKIGRHWMNLEGFFYRRDIPDALPRLIAWFEDVVAGRDPRSRPGNFMAD